MKKFKFKIENETFEVSVTEKGKNVAEVVVNGKSHTVEFEKEEAAKQVISPKPVQKATTAVTPPKATPPPPPAAPKKVAANAKSVISPLPGSIFKIPVSVGQTIKSGDLLVVIESMKMENNILADRDGVIKAIHVQISQSVLQGDALVDLD